MIFLLFGVVCADRFVPPFEYRGTVWPMPREIKSTSDLRLNHKLIVLDKAFCIVRRNSFDSFLTNSTMVGITPTLLGFEIPNNIILCPLIIVTP